MNICVFVVIIFVTLITIFCVLPIRANLGGIIGVIPGSVLISEEQAPVSVLDAKAPWVAACKEMHDIDYIFWKGERSEAFSVQSSPGGEAHKEIYPLVVTGWPRVNGPCGLFLHRVFMVLINLHILAKLEAIVLVIVNS